MACWPRRRKLVYLDRCGSGLSGQDVRTLIVEDSPWERAPPTRQGEHEGVAFSRDGVTGIRDHRQPLESARLHLYRLSRLGGEEEFRCVPSSR